MATVTYFGTQSATGRRSTRSASGRKAKTGKASKTLSEAVVKTGGSAIEFKGSATGTAVRTETETGKVKEEVTATKEKQVEERPTGTTVKAREIRPSPAYQVREGGRTYYASEEALMTQYAQEYRQAEQQRLFRKQGELQQSMMVSREQPTRQTTPQREPEYVVEPAPERSAFQQARVSVRRQADIAKEQKRPFIATGLEAVAVTGDVAAGVITAAKRTPSAVKERVKAAKEHEGSATLQFFKVAQRPEQTLPSSEAVFGVGYGIGQTLRINPERAVAEALVIEAGGVGIFKGLQRVTAKGIAIKRFKKLEKAEGFGEQATGYRFIEQRVRTPEIVESPRGRTIIEKTSEISRIETLTPDRPTVTTMVRTTPKATERTVAVGKRQVSVAETTVRGEKYFLRTTATPEKTVSALYKGDKLQDVFVGDPSPRRLFTEPIKKRDVPRTTTIRKQGMIAEAEGQILTSRSISARRQPDIKVRISDITERRVGVRQPFKQTTERLSPASPIGIDVPRETARKVDVPYLQFTDEGLLEPSRTFIQRGQITKIRQPTTVTEQVRRQRTTFILQPSKRNIMIGKRGELQLGRSRTLQVRRQRILEPTRDSQLSIRAIRYDLKAPTRVSPMLMTTTQVSEIEKRKKAQRPSTSNLMKTSNILEPESMIRKAQRPISGTLPKSAQAQMLKQQTATKAVPTPITPSSSPFKPSTRGIRPELPRVITPTTAGAGFDFKQSTPKRKTKKKKQKVKETDIYTPSVEAELFGIYGKRPKGFRSGLVARPLTR